MKYAYVVLLVNIDIPALTINEHFMYGTVEALHRGRAYKLITDSIWDVLPTLKKNYKVSKVLLWKV